MARIEAHHARCGIGLNPCYAYGSKQRDRRMSSSSLFRAALATTAMLLGMGFSSAAQAETCGVSFTIVKSQSGFAMGTQSGRGVMRCKGRRYPFQISGTSQGIMAGASETRYIGRATF